VLGFGRAMGETMIVLMASGNASIVSWNLFDSARAITATIAAEMAEAVFGGHHYRMLFLLGLLLLGITFVANVVADWVLTRLKARLGGTP
jgi:phosphate transport system permease protein